MGIAGRVLEQLYAVPPGAFVRERNARVAALRTEGRTAEARAVQQLRRPSPTLWATNQLARVDAQGLRAFLDAVTRVRRTQLRDPRAAGDALRQQRAGLEALLQRAGDLLQQQGHRLTAAAARRLSNTLLGAAAEPRHAQDLLHGRLSAELPPPGFEVLAGAGGDRPFRALPGGQGTGRDDATRRENEAGRRRENDPARREEDERARREAGRRRHQRQADELAHAAAEHRTAAEQVEREVDELARGLAEARRRLRAARRVAQASATAARRARDVAAR